MIARFERTIIKWRMGDIRLFHAMKDTMIFVRHCRIESSSIGDMAIFDQTKVMVQPCFIGDGRDHDYLFYIQYLDNDRIIYVFDTIMALKWFLKLIEIQGIGCRFASRILKSIPLSLFQESLLHHDVEGLTKISGVSRKIAQRIIDALSACDLLDRLVSDTNGQGGYTQVKAVLKSLGYDDMTISSVLSRISGLHLDDPQLILKQALKVVEHE